MNKLEGKTSVSSAQQCPRQLPLCYSCQNAVWRSNGILGCMWITKCSQLHCQTFPLMPTDWLFQSLIPKGKNRLIEKVIWFSFKFKFLFKNSSTYLWARWTWHRFSFLVQILNLYIHNRKPNFLCFHYQKPGKKYLIIKNVLLEPVWWLRNIRNYKMFLVLPNLWLS